jgi:2-polyprenyl-3-methyl-5-hydroxy-6-metoxy-1,4-benzoquinol methylase
LFAKIIKVCVGPSAKAFRLKPLPGDMSEHSRPYVIHSDDECERLELQARLAKIEQHLRYLPVSPRDRVLDAGCGSGSMSRLIARSFPEAEVTGVDLREPLHFGHAAAIVVSYA